MTDRVLAEVERARDESSQFTSELIRIPTVNPPGEAYEDCARLIGDRLAACDFDVEYFAAEGLPGAHRRASAAERRRHPPRPCARGRAFT